MAYISWVRVHCRNSNSVGSWKQALMQRPWFGRGDGVAIYWLTLYDLLSSLFSFFLLLIILFTYISNDILLPSFPSTNPLSHCLYEGAPPPTHPLLPHSSSIPLHWGIEPQEQGPLLPLMPDKTILFYICIDYEYSWEIFKAKFHITPQQFSTLIDY